MTAHVRMRERAPETIRLAGRNKTKTQYFLQRAKLTTPVVLPPIAESAAAVLMRIGLAIIRLPLTAGDMRRSCAAPLGRKRVPTNIKQR